MQDKETIIDQLRCARIVLKQLSHTLRADKEIVMAALDRFDHEYGDDDFEYMTMLEYASVELQADKEVVLKSLIQNGNNLEYASEELQNDKEVVLKAIQNPSWGGTPLQFAGSKLKSDPEVVKLAVFYDTQALAFASESLRNDQKFIAELDI